jgi:hypothetical protein
LELPVLVSPVGKDNLRDCRKSKATVLQSCECSGYLCWSFLVDWRSVVDGSFAEALGPDQIRMKIFDVT